MPNMDPKKCPMPVAVPDVDGMAQNFAFVRSVGKLNGVIRSSKVTSGYS